MHFEIESYEYQKRISFIKQLLVSVAPLWLGTCAIMELRNIFTNNDLIGIKIISVVSIIIIMYVFVPSSADIRFISFIIGLKPFVFIKQVLFLTISFLIYNAFFDFFYRFAPIYPYLFEFIMLILLEGGLELVFMILKFVIPKILSITPSNTIGFYSNSRIDTAFPSRNRRRKDKKYDPSELFTLLPPDDETAAEEFAQAMIENNAMMIDIENPEDEQ